MKAQSLFITGTDTGVGKTLVTALLALRLQAQGADVAVMKPLASGCTWENGGLVSEDAQWLRDVTGVSDEMELINPLRYEEPLAPLVAARRLGRDTSRDLEKCNAAFRELQSRHEVVLVEGVGGLLVPICESEKGDVFDCTHLASTLELPLVVVARRALGTINHTLLTCRTPLQSPSKIIGLLFSDATSLSEEDIAAQTSPELICKLTGIPCWGEVPYLGDLTSRELRKVAQQFIALQ